MANHRLLLKNRMSPDNPIVFLDFQIGKRKPERVYIELYAHICPLTCENFRQFCIGFDTGGEDDKPPIGYKGSPVHKIVKGFFLQGGDFISGDGSGTASIYEYDYFDDEGFNVSHDDIGVISMVSPGPNLNGCQFMLTLNKGLEYLDKTQVAFGKICEENSIYPLLNMSNVMVSSDNAPLTPISICDCGEI